MSRLTIGALSAALAMTATALDFQRIDGEDIGINQHLREARESGLGGWLWSPLAWCDASGCWVQTAFHNCYGPLFKRQPDGTYELVPVPPNPENDRVVTAGSQPILMDVDNNGLMDLIGIDDECRWRTSSVLHTVDGWEYADSYTLKDGKGSTPMDLNGDGLLDLKDDETNFINTGTGWNWQPKTVQDRLAPTNAPQDIVDRAVASDAQKGRYQEVRVYPMGSDWLITYGGSYNVDRVAKWTVVIRDGAVVFDNPGEAAKPVIIDATPAFLLRRNKYNDDNGLYMRRPDGSYQAGNLPAQSVRRVLGNGGYIWDIEAHDFDADGDDDLILEGKLHRFSYLLENTGDGFALYREIPTARGQPIHVADVDADGDLDIVNTGGGDDAGNSARLWIWINQSNLTAVRTSSQF